jgi:hypothetical protein
MVTKHMMKFSCPKHGSKRSGSDVAAEASMPRKREGKSEEYESCRQ